MPPRPRGNIRFPRLVTFTCLLSILIFSSSRPPNYFLSAPHPSSHSFSVPFLAQSEALTLGERVQGCQLARF